MKFVLWFEPERVYRGSFLWDNHPDWLLKWKDKDDICLLNLGNPDARRWITECISQFITEQGVDLYRQDFNVNPLKAWQNTDTDDRQGMTENLYVQGYLAYWDDLLRQHPGMLIDSCSGGGGQTILRPCDGLCLCCAAIFRPRIRHRHTPCRPMFLTETRAIPMA